MSRSLSLQLSGCLFGCLSVCFSLSLSCLARTHNSAWSRCCCVRIAVGYIERVVAVDAVVAAAAYFSARTKAPDFRRRVKQTAFPAYTPTAVQNQSTFSHSRQTDRPLSGNLGMREIQRWREAPKKLVYISYRHTDSSSSTYKRFKVPPFSGFHSLPYGLRWMECKQGLRYGEIRDEQVVKKCVEKQRAGSHMILPSKNAPRNVSIHPVGDPSAGPLALPLATASFRLPEQSLSLD